MDINHLAKANGSLKVRHVISTHGRLPRDPSVEPGSGVVGAALGLAQAQTKAGHAVEVWGWNDKQRSQQTLWNGIKLWTSPEWSWARFARWDLSWLAPIGYHSLSKMPVDVLHVHVDPNLLYIPGAQVRLLHLQTPVLNPLPPSYQRLLQRAHAVICCSNFIRSRFLDSSGFPAKQTFVVHNGADLNAYLLSDGSKLRTRWGFDENDFVILYTGAIVPEKGVMQLVKAFAQIQSDLPNVALVIVGGAQLWAMPGGNTVGETYEASVRRLAQGLNIRFVGSLPRNQLPSAYSAADLVVVPSVWDDPHPTVVCEAMAAGRAVVASRAGGITETVDHGRTGTLVSPGNEADLAEAIQTIAINKHLRDQMQGAALERAKGFSWEASAEYLEKIYLNLLTNSNGRQRLGSEKKGEV